jgi:hypothetical protein
VEKRKTMKSKLKLNVVSLKEYQEAVESSARTQSSTRSEVEDVITGWMTRMMENEAKNRVFFCATCKVVANYDLGGFIVVQPTAKLGGRGMVAGFCRACFRDKEWRGEFIQSLKKAAAEVFPQQ